MKLNTKLLCPTLVLGLALVGCKPVPYEQDGSELWMAGARPYEEVLASVESHIDPSLAPEEYHIYDGDGKRHVAGGSPAGVRYGVYALQRAEVLGEDAAPLDLRSKPFYDYRILNHWDNMDDTVERGYAGLSMWEWTSPEIPVERIRQYAELCASVGINGAVLNNVNSNPVVLDREHLERIAKIAAILREYGIRSYVSIKWTSPLVLDGVKKGDPLYPELRQWWKDKAAEIYSLIPDFGGFLVKANSEGQEGPQDYGRSHADGANMLAEALAPYGGIVMWRAFVYSPTSPDRANQAVEEFKPLDGQFADNVFIQIKNGPVDFQAREPFNPLFGQLKNTKMMAEFQITQEYLGFSNHLVYHGPTYEECLDSDTFRDGEGSTVARMIKGVAGVANTGQDKNFCGYIFAQSNWYLFGRLAWDPELNSADIAYEWIRQTFKTPEGMSPAAFDRKFITPVHAIMMGSRETAVNYTMPMGLHHLFAGSHYGPGPWERSIRPDWSPYYYHKADSLGIGFDRTMKGSGNVGQYNEPLASTLEGRESCPENLILWFHHLGWDEKLSSGRSVWDELCLHYDRGIKTVADYQKTWNSLRPYVSESIFLEVEKKLDIQHNDAIWWRDACVGYFQLFSNRALPSDVEPLQTPIDSLMIKSVLSDRYGMPTHDENNKPVLVKNRRFLAPGMSSH